MSPPRSLIPVLLLCVLLPPGLSLAAQEPEAPAPGESVTAPPLVPVEAAPAPDLSAAPREAPAQLRQGSSIPLGVRAFGELLGGGLTGAAGGLVGALLGATVADCEGEGCLGPFFLGMFAGAVTGLPVGVYGAGRLMGVQADSTALWGSYLGMGVVGGAALVAALNINDSDGLSFIGVPVGALVGAIAGFELTASLSDSSPRPRPGPALRLAPSVGTTPRGGFMGGLSGSF